MTEVAAAEAFVVRLHFYLLLKVRLLHFYAQRCFAGCNLKSRNICKLQLGTPGFFEVTFACCSLLSLPYR